MFIIFRRHAVTEGNTLKKYIGATDEPITEEGIRLANLIQKNLQISKVYTSSLKRTVETARIIYPNAKIIPIDGLNEINFGKFEGKTWSELEKNIEYCNWIDSYCESKCPDGESKKEFTNRVITAFKNILEKEKNEESIYFVIHGGTIMAILSELAIPKRDYFDWKVNHLEGYVIKKLDKNESLEIVCNLLADGS